MASIPLLHRLLTERPPDHLFHHDSGRGPARAPADDAAVRFRWLGTAGFEVRAAGRSLLLDPYLSRPSLSQTLFRPLVPDPAAVRARIEGADYIFAGHSHHDHAMDIGAIAQQTGARIYGSESALRIARIDGVEERALCHVAAGDAVEAGPFRARILRSVHGKVFAGRIPFPGRISRDEGPLKVRDFRVGASFGLWFEVGGVRFLHLGSADFLESAMHGVACDVLLLCIIGRDGSPGFTHRILRTLRPKVVIPCHWDDFALPFDSGARALRRAKLRGFVEEVETAGTGTQLVLLDFFGEFTFSRGSTP